MPQVKELIVDAYGCRGDLSDVARMEQVAREAVTEVGARIAGSAHHRFQPHGLTLCLILMESHLVLSTWPEHEMAVLNVFLCNDSMDPRRVWETLQRYLKPEQAVFHWVPHRIGKKAKAA